MIALFCLRACVLAGAKIALCCRRATQSMAQRTPVLQVHARKGMRLRRQRWQEARIVLENQRCVQRVDGPVQVNIRILAARKLRKQARVPLQHEGGAAWYARRHRQPPAR